MQSLGLDYFNPPRMVGSNRVWANDHVRRAHIDVVDARESAWTMDDARMLFSSTNQ